MRVIVVVESSKTVVTAASAVAGIEDGMTVHVGGWGGIGVPDALITALAAKGPKNLTITTNNCGMGRPGDVGELFKAGCVARVITTFPVHAGAADFRFRLESGEVVLEVLPQGTLAERLRAAGAGLGGFFTPTGVGTPIADGKLTRTVDGRTYVFEDPLPGDFALIKAAQSDPWGNLRFRFASRGFNPVMAMAAKHTVVQAQELVRLGSIAPDDVHLSGVFVDRVYVEGART
ncbi:MAG: 3-oxoacid CoA-transferase subunit A [Bifidobacteriaceae bacterium]|jgi:3-oxoadipate CoA-transferase alpha subunit|nr:3-oxoacid CoA-transferase subunit A [Bifidobacteriaceae bacterium]